MAADVLQFHILRSTSRTNEQAYDALRALPLWSAFLPDDFSDFTNGHEAKGYQLWYRAYDVVDDPEAPVPTVVGKGFSILVDRVDFTKPSVQERKEQLLDVYRALDDGNAALIPAHLGDVNWIKQLDGTNHIVALKFATPPHTYLGLETPEIA